MVIMKDLNMRSFWIIQLDHKSNGKCLYKRKAVGDLREKKEKKRREERGVKREAEIAMMPRNKPRITNSHRKLEEARTGFSPGNLQR